MIDTPLDILLVMFQEDRYFWAIADLELNRVDCRFCGGVGDRPETVNHNEGCVIQMATRMIMSDENYLHKVKGRPPRRIYKGTATLTVYRPGHWRDAKWVKGKKKTER